MSVETKLLLGLAFLAVVDVVIPVPLTALAVGYAILAKPQWARQAVAELFDPDDRTGPRS